MYRGFNLDAEKTDKQSFLKVKEGSLSKYESKLTDVIELVKSNMREIVEIPISEEGDIDGSELISSWFPTINNMDIFISHSHNDSRTAKRLAIWLEEEFGLRVFLDSLVWGSADELLKEIDNRFSYLRTEKDDTKIYSYGKRNYTTSHIHMMLVSALMEMIHKTELIVFINTPHSIKPGDTKNRKTTSPWIYSELTIASLVEKTKPERYSNQYYKRAIKSNEYLADAWNFSISYNVENKLFKSFQSLTLHDLELWASEFEKVQAEQMEDIHALDVLYKNKPIDIRGDGYR